MRALTKILIFCLFFFSGTTIFAQEKTIEGKVVDESGVTIVGTNIAIKGTSKGTVSDIEGNFKLSNIKKGDILVFSSIGYKNKEITFTDQSFLEVTLQENVQHLDEVVVVGYGIQKKSDVTGSLISVDSKTIKDVQSNSIATVLQGRAAGVSVVKNSGTPGSNAEINIRGISSINGAPPLWIVDGVPTSGDINPLDIDRIEILKDASATAIYGTKAAGGVIIITTKKGKKGVNHLAYNSRFSFSTLAKKLNLLDAEEWAKLRVEAYQNVQLPVPPSLKNKTFNKTTDWQDAITRRAFSQSHFVSFSGGTDKINYYMSLSNDAQKGIVLKTDDNTTALRLNTSSQVTKWFKIGENLSISSNKNHAINEDDEWNAILIQAIAIDPITPIRKDDGSWGGTVFNSIDNPVAHIDRTHDETRTMAAGGDIYATINPFSGFSFTSRFGYEYSEENEYIFNPTFFVKTGEENTVSGVSRSFSEYKDWIVSNFATYEHNFSKHNLKFMLGNDIEKETNEWFGLTASNLISEQPSMIYIDNASGSNSALANGMGNDIRYLSYFGRINYNYSGKYLLTANIRYQGSSKFGPDRRFGLFPSVSLGWKISNEKFFENIHFINNLKIRLGYGKTGNDLAIKPYSYYTGLRAGQRYVWGNKIVDGVSFPLLGNPELHWEEKLSTNMGINLGILNDKFTFIGDLFIDKTNDMLYNPALPGHVGAQEYPYTNIASLQNVGYEFQLGYKNKIGKIKYDFNLNFSHVANKILSLGSAEYIADAPFMQLGYISRTEVGHPMAMFYGYKTDGLFQNQAEIDAYVDKNGNLIQPNAKPGDIKYLDADRNGKLDLDFIGDPFPDFTAGLNIHLQYGNFDFTSFLYTVYGNDIFNATKFFTMNPSMRYNGDASMKDRWLIEGDTNDPNHARLNIQDANNSFRSDRFVEDGSYIRVKNIQLAYNINKEKTKKMHLTSIQVFIGAENLYTLTKYTGYDPEIGIGYYGPLDRGIDRVDYPNPRTFYFGLNLNF